MVYGIAPVTGTMYPSQYTCAPAHPRPIIHLHGTVDFLVPYASTVRDWHVYSARIACSASSEREVFRSGSVHCDEYEQCPGTSAPGKSAFCTYTGMGHTWPGSNYALPATETVWTYFQGTSPLSPGWTTRAGFASVDLNITSLDAA